MVTSTRYDIIPVSDEKIVVWGAQFLAATTQETGDTGPVAPDLSTKINELSGLIAKAIEVQNAYKHAFSLKKKARIALEKALRAEVKRIKASPNYTETEGVRLGIERQAKTIDLSDTVPQITLADKTGGVVELSFAKGGSDGINVYGQRDGDTDWVLLGYSARSPFKDSRPLLVTGQAELRRYTVIYVKRQQEVGAFSNEAVIACAP